MGIPLSADMVRSVENRFRPGMMRWRYEDGLVLYASLGASDDAYDWVHSMYSCVIGSDGSISGYREGEYNLDMINAGKTLLPLYERSGEERFLKAAERLHRQLESQPRCRCGVYWHKEIYPWQIWLDGLYMEGPFSLAYADLKGDGSIVDDIIGQLATAFGIMRDAETGLLYHAYDESRGMRWSDEETGLSPHFWSRSIGWYLMALFDALDHIPSSHPGRNRIISMAAELSGSVLAFQSPTGMWYQVTDQGGRDGNYLETSASSMFAYSYLKGVRLGCLSKEYAEAARKALEDISSCYLERDDDGDLHLGGICSVAGLGGNPYRDGSFRYYISEPVVFDDFKGVGPFILALSESERLS